MRLERLTIDWSSLDLEISRPSGGSRKIDWNVPHAIYKDTKPLDDPSQLGRPHVIIEEEKFTWTDTFVAYDTPYYYRLSELLPGGEYFSDPIKVEVKLHILKYETPYLANIAYNNSAKSESGELLQYITFDLSKRDSDGDQVEVIKNEWYWDGTGRISEWLEILVNDTPRVIRTRSDFQASIHNFSTTKDRRNYVAGMLNTMPVRSRAYYDKDGEVQQAPYWWREWHDNVNTRVPESWHEFWEERREHFDDSWQWYDSEWKSNPSIRPYDTEVLHSMHATSIAPFYPTREDLILRARINTTLSNGSIVSSGDTVTGVPREGSNAGVGLGATLTMSKALDSIRDGATLTFDYNARTYSIVLNGVSGAASAHDYDLLTDIMSTQINDHIISQIGDVPPDVSESHIDVSFGPVFHIL